MLASSITSASSYTTARGAIAPTKAVIESFWSRMQVELFDRQRWRTKVELANAIVDCLKIFHNRQCRHSALGTLTPVEFENHNQPMTAA